MYSYPQYTGAHPVHNVDRMLGVPLSSVPRAIGCHQLMSMWGNARSKGLPGLADDSRRVIQAFRDMAHPKHRRDTKAPSDSPNMFKRHESSSRSSGHS